MLLETHSTVKAISWPTHGDLDVARSAKVSFNKDDDERLQDENHVRGLVNFLYKNDHMSPFEHSTFTFYVETPLFVRSEFMRHRTCVTGDTLIRLSSPNDISNSRHKTISSIWEDWHLRRKPPSVQNIHAVSVDETTGRSIANKIINVQKMGIKPVVKITTVEGRSLRLTHDHEVRTPNGYIEAGNLNPEDVIHVIGTYGISTPDPLVSKELRIENAFKRGGLMSGAVEDVIASIEPDGEEEVYDLEMEAPNHNFTANGIVVHNCSYNEISGRYTKFDLKGYIPDEHRPIIQEGKTGAYTFTYGDDSLHQLVDEAVIESYETCEKNYEKMLEAGVAKEVARVVMPVGIYTKFYATMNARNLMHFLSLRTDPQALYEIREVAGKMEDIFKEHMPMTHSVWKENPRK